MSDSIYSYQILSGGYGVDGILTGTVTRYMPDEKETIYFKNKKGRIESEIFLKEAQVGISAKFIDGDTGEIVWSDNYSYSGFDIDDTINVVVEVILERLRKVTYEGR